MGSSKFEKAKKGKCSNESKSQSQKESNETITDQLPTASSTDEMRKRWAILKNRSDFINPFRTVVGMIILYLTLTLLIMLCAAAIVPFGISIYSVLLGFHSFLILCFYTIHYQLLLPLLDECSSIVYNLETGTSNVPAKQPPKKKRSWFSLRHLLPFVTNAGIWLYLSCTVFAVDVKTEYQKSKDFCVCIFLGVLQVLVTFSALTKIGLAPRKPKMKSARVEQGEKDASSSNFKKENYDGLMDLQREGNKILMELLEEFKTSRQEE